MKRKGKVLTFIVSMAMVAAILPVTAMAEGGLSIDNTYLVIEPGNSGYVTIYADNATGRVDWSGSGSVESSGSVWLENGSATIDISALQPGTGYITVTPVDFATFDGEEITSGYTIQVDVPGEVEAAAEEPAQDVQTDYEEPVYEQQETTTQQETTVEQETTTVSTEVLTDGNTDYEELSEEDRLYSTVEDKNLYIIRYPLMLAEDGSIVWNEEVSNLEQLEGFERITVNYKGLDVDAFEYDSDLRVFVLKNPETNLCGYYILENGVGFSPLSYLTANGKPYIVINFPDDFVVPEGYQMVEMTLGTNKVQALKKITEETVTTADDAAAQPEETTAAPETEAAETAADGSALKIKLDQRNLVMLNGYETVVSPGIDSADPSGDIYYIYCLVDGKTQLYSYDSGEGTLQRSSIVVYNEIPTEPETVIVYEQETTQSADAVSDTASSLLKGIGWHNMAIQMKVLLIALAVAIILIIILIILYIVLSSKNKKYNRKARRASHNNIPPRTRGNSVSADENRYSSRGNAKNKSKNKDTEMDDETFFSYVKTENDDFDLGSLS